MIQAQTGGVQAVGFGERLVAYIIDLVVLVFIDLVFLVLLGPMAGRLIGALASIAYVVGFWAASGATPGKMLMGLRVVTREGERIGGGTAVLRYVGYIVSGLALLLGFLWIIWDPDHEGWHDKIAGTRVIKG